VQLGSAAVALSIVALAVGRLLFTPTQGDLLVLLSARAPDRVGASSVEIHSRSGWESLGGFGRLQVPKAPNTAAALHASIPVGSYDALRLGGEVLPARITAQQNVIATVLVAISGGRPVQRNVYAGSEAVSLGLNELAGHLQPMPGFSLVDQFGRPFTNQSLARHEVILAAFHTTCQASCPLYTGLFLQLRKRLPPSVLLVEVTTDPVTDTPPVLREYAGRVGASWTFATGPPDGIAAFWKPFDVELSSVDGHRSTLALIDEHGYIRSFWQGAPDVGGSLPATLRSQLNGEGQKELRSRGDGWGQAQVIDSLQAIGGLASPSSTGEGSAPAFTLTTLDGHQGSLDDFRGKPALINFWATWCAPCRREMPLIEQTAARHPNLEVLLVDERDDQGSASSFVKQLGIRSTVPFDGDGDVGDRYGITGLPTTVFVRSDGTIEGRYVGETNQQILSPHITAVGA
jgi:cytochrome oxidase Cu insertion factor (SCO1/SenC/PrrC family)